MTQVTPLRWTGPTRRAALQREVERRLQGWASGWLRGDERPVLSAADPLPARLSWSVATAPSGELAVGLVHDGLEALGAALLGCTAAGAAGLAQGIGARALRDLARALLGEDDVQPAGGERSPRELAPRAGGLLLRLQLPGVSLWLHADAALCAHWAPRPAPAARALVRRRDAIGPLAARLVVSLPLGPLALADVSGLRPGDVLRTQVRVGGLVRMTSDDGTVARVGHLAASGEHRAIRIQ